MIRGTLIPRSAGVELICMRPKAGVIQVELRACQAVAVCPSCGSRSSRVHSRYWRTIADLPWEGILVRISLRIWAFLESTKKSPKSAKKWANRMRILILCGEGNGECCGKLAYLLYLQ
jgi:transposase